MSTFQQLVLRLQDYWDRKGCAILQPYDMEVGAGTSHTATFLRALGPEPWRAGYVQPSRRPKDGRYGDNPNRLQHYYQFQVVLKPSPPDILDLYLDSLHAVGFDLKKNDVRFVEDDWENPTLGAWGLGWEVWLNGMEITQFTYFQQVGGIDCKPITGEITYGLERLAMYLQGVENVYRPRVDRVRTGGRTQLPTATCTTRTRWSSRPTTSSTADVPSAVPALRRTTKTEAKHLMHAQLALPGLRAGAQGRAHVQPADARGAISVTERAAYIGRIRTLARAVAQSYHESRERLGFPMLEGGGLMAATLLVELFTEELPPKALERLGHAFAEGIEGGHRKKRGLLEAIGHVMRIAAPRRLAWPSAACCRLGAEPAAE